MQISDHFKLSEFERSTTAKAFGFTNIVPDKLIPSIRNLCNNILEPLREHIGVPVIIGSGYRCPSVNKIIGGVSNSQHMRGEAADISAPKYDINGKRLSEAQSQKELKNWFLWLKENTDYDQLILERLDHYSSHYWIHVSCKPKASDNRHQVIYDLVKH